MDLAAVLAVLGDLPSTFTKEGPPYAQFVDSVATAKSRYTECADATLSQVALFSNALDGWLDVWGLLWGVPRIDNEANVRYAARIQETVLAWVGTLPSIQVWLDLFAAGGTVVENTGLGYVVTLPASLTTSQVQAFLLSLNRIRPAGVPFTVQQLGSGLFLDTVEFLGQGPLAGSYLTGGSQPVSIAFLATTLSAKPLLPDLYLVDPTINPGLQP